MGCPQRPKSCSTEEGVNVSDGILVTECEGVLEIIIDRPDQKNALTTAMYNQITSALRDAETRGEIGAVLIGARGDAFCAGNDLKDFMAGPAGMDAALEFVGTIVAFGKPIVAAVQGIAVGVGATMLFHCDLVYASTDARFIMPFVNLGLLPEAGSSLLAPMILGHAKASAMLLLGEPMNAEAADRAGFVTAVIAAEDLLEHARSKAIALVKQPPMALQTTRRLLRGDRQPLEARIAEETHHFREALKSAEAQEAFTAFFERRPPIFKR